MSYDLLSRRDLSHMTIDSRCGLCHMMEFVTIISISVIEGEDLLTRYKNRYSKEIVL